MHQLNRFTVFRFTRFSRGSVKKLMKLQCQQNLTPALNVPGLNVPGLNVPGLNA